MSCLTYLSLDQRYRVVSRNFWFTAQHFWAGKWRDLGKTRSQDAAVGITVSVQNLSA